MKELWNAAPFYIKVLVVVLFPLVVLLFLFGKGQTVIKNLIETATRKKVDILSTASKDRERNLELDEARLSGELKQLEKDKRGAKKNADNDDPTKFHNNR